MLKTRTREARIRRLKMFSEEDRFCFPSMSYFEFNIQTMSRRESVWGGETQKQGVEAKITSSARNNGTVIPSGDGYGFRWLSWIQLQVEPKELFVRSVIWVRRLRKWVELHRARGLLSELGKLEKWRERRMFGKTNWKMKNESIQCWIKCVFLAHSKS